MAEAEVVGEVGWGEEHGGDGFGGVGRAELGEVLSAVAFGQALAEGVAQQGNVGEFGYGVAQQFVKVNLHGRGGEQVFAAHHFGYAHQGVVNHYGELVGPGAVGALKNEVAAVARQVEALRAEVAVGEADVAVGHPEPDRVAPGGEVDAAGHALGAAASAVDDGAV